MVSVAIEHLLARSSTLITHRENRPSLVLARDFGRLFAPASPAEPATKKLAGDGSG
jgi:hypothetical protein